MPLEDRFAELRRRNQAADLGGGAERIARQHKAGKKTARERLELLLDKGSFAEMDKLVVHQGHDFGMDDQRIPGDGVVIGSGRMHGRPVFVFAQDFTVFGGSLSEAYARKICKIMDLAMKTGVPIIGLNDSGGARIQEGVVSLAGYADIFLRNTLASGVVPQISAILGPCAGGAVYSPAITDFVFMVKGSSYMFVTGPEVIKAVTHEEVSFEELGGARHAWRHLRGGALRRGERGGVPGPHPRAHDLPAPEQPRGSAVPANPRSSRPRGRGAADASVPDQPNKPYDIKDVVRTVLDDKYFFEVQADYAPNLVVGFGRLGGRPVGIVANQPAHLAGCLDINASLKGARFVRFCDCFNIPLVTFEDVPGFLPGTAQEFGGIIKHGAKLLYAFCEATVPEAHRHHAQGLRRRVLRHVVQAHPRRRQLRLSDGGDRGDGPRRRGQHPVPAARWRAPPIPPRLKDEKTREYREKFANPFVAAERGYVDEVIEPRDTRRRLIQALEVLHTKRDTNPPKKHGNIPL